MTWFRRSAKQVRSALFGDGLARNSTYLMLGTVTASGFGFLFWMLSAHLFPSGVVGVATSLVSAASLIAYFSLLGLGTALTRFLPSESDPGRQVGAGILVVCFAALSISAGYMVAIRVSSPTLAGTVTTPWLAGAFCILTAAMGVTLLLDSVFVAMRSAQYSFLLTGALQGLGKLMLPQALLFAGAFGLFASATLPALLTSAAGLVLLKRRFGVSSRPRSPRVALRHLLVFSGGSYLASVLNLVPMLVLPLIILDQEGSSAAAYFFAAFQMAQLLNAIPFATGASLLAEASRPLADVGTLASHAIRRTLLILCPAIALTVLLGYQLLRMFGESYAAHGYSALVLLAVGAVAVALNSWASSLLRVTRQLRAAVLSNAAYVVVIVGLPFIWHRPGVTCYAVAWGVGNLVSGVWAFLAYRAPKSARPGLGRHRDNTRQPSSREGALGADRSFRILRQKEESS